MKKVLWSCALGSASPSSWHSFLRPPRRRRARGEGVRCGLREGLLPRSECDPHPEAQYRDPQGRGREAHGLRAAGHDGLQRELQQKYAGMMILERKTIGRRHGRRKPGPMGSGSRSRLAPRALANWFVYDVGGAKVGEAAAQYDAGTRPARAAPVRERPPLRRPPLGRDQVGPSARGGALERAPPSRPPCSAGSPARPGTRPPSRSATRHAPGRPLPRRRGRSAPGDRSRSRCSACASPRDL